MINSILQWTGTSAFLVMYVIMSFFPEMHPYNLVVGCIGGVCYLMWSIRVRNKPQVLANFAGIAVCIAGLIKNW